jgi:hypothetical protein
LSRQRGGNILLVAQNRMVLFSSAPAMKITLDKVERAHAMSHDPKVRRAVTLDTN